MWSKARSAKVKKVFLFFKKSVLTDEIHVRRLIFYSTAKFREKNWFMQQILEFLCSCFVQFTLINVRYFKMAIVTLLFINDTFVNVAHPLNKQKCHFSPLLLQLVFSPIYQTVKLFFADRKFELSNIINHTPFSIINSGI